ncbi:glycine betaine ABC transporter substrate-binding protein [Catenisphaera adipataccumulans]|uniref:Osmoprotectant transport system permease protein n=1 Tax=Catenisphaera adipataccumulans TaxID=700500 RepID=A0A7W8FV09_9FIRM|nr:glycine betaine ABC transporter substrate-binding protein [Catenisphaera adipataccumulans]MBB5183129.1 osmoprotectant transport system permease protein [Catenisphaera adipataccumulans]
MNWSVIVDHLFIVLTASVLSVVIGIPLGIIAYLFPKSRSIILHLVDIFQTIPALALLGMIMVLIGAGKTTVIIGILLYSLLPIVRNTYLGLSEIEPGIREAARGVGMTRMERITKVEFPLAFPSIFTGIRLALINAIGTAVFAAYVGGGGIGGIMNQAIRTRNMTDLLQATGALMVMAVVLDLIMSFCENRVRQSHNSTRRILASLAVLVGLCFVTIPGEMSVMGSSEGLVMYDGDYTEVRIMDRIAKEMIEDQTDLTVTIKDQMTQVNQYKSLIGDDHTCDMMLSYDGTLLTTFLHKDPTDVPEGETLYHYANRIANKRNDISLVGKLGFNNTYAIAVTQAVADKYNLKTISDLAAVSDQLTFGAEHDFFTEEGSMKYEPFCEFYGMHFKEAKSVDVSLKYDAIEDGEFEVTEVFATDGLNLKANLVILEDDQHFFPEYNGSFLIRNDVYERFKDEAPNLKSVLKQLDGQISTEDMEQMTYQVDVKGKDVDEVAHQFLVDNDLLKN